MRSLLVRPLLLTVALLAAAPAHSPLASMRPLATVKLGGTPDWLAVTTDSVWVSNARLRAVQRVDVASNRLVAKVVLPARPCSGLAAGFGSIWVPLCGKPRRLARVDPRTNRVTAVLPIGPADSEGGIAASADSIWLVVDKNGTLVRLDPRSGRVRQRISIAKGSYNPLFHDGKIWISGLSTGVLTAVDASSGARLAVVHVGPKPRFLTASAGAIWTLNQGDGTVSRIDAAAMRLTATVRAAIPGPGGEIAYGAGSVWATIVGVPLTQIDTQTNAVVHRWTGPGGDSVRFGHDAIWLTDYEHGLLWRFPVPAAHSMR